MGRPLLQVQQKPERYAAGVLKKYYVLTKKKNSHLKILIFSKIRFSLLCIVQSVYTGAIFQNSIFYEEQASILQIQSISTWSFHRDGEVKPYEPIISRSYFFFSYYDTIICFSKENKTQFFNKSKSNFIKSRNREFLKSISYYRQYLIIFVSVYERCFSVIVFESKLQML